MRFNIVHRVLPIAMMLLLGGVQLFAQADKSKSKAVWLSLAVPGLGEYYLNNWKTPSTGRYFIGGELVTWASYFYLNAYGGWIHDDAKVLAARQAGVKLSSAKPSNFYYTISKNASIYSYNESERRLNAGARVYAETEDNYWQWKDEHSRRKYNAMRYDGSTYKRLASYLVFAGIVNRVLSVAQTVRVFNRMQNSGISMRMDIIPETRTRARTQFSLIKSF